jgi:hypothetical protein
MKAGAGPGAAAAAVWRYPVSMSAEGTVPTPITAPAPPRPDAVPADATWNAEAGEWEQVALDGQRRREGLALTWRADGTAAAAYQYRAGERHGPFRRFHPDGSLAREGRFVEGRPHGTVVAHGHAAPTPEPLQSCCVPPGAWQLHHEYDQGHVREIRWYDQAGVRILPSGQPHPPRPASVPRDVPYEEGRAQWVSSRYTPTGSADGIWRRWDVDGVLRERDEFLAGQAHGLWQRFDGAGGLTDEGHWREGQRCGPYRRIGVPGDLYADERVHEERGHFERDQAVGRWSHHDAQGLELARFELGGALDDEGLRGSPALAAATASAARWETTADELERTGRPAEALLASARAAAASARVDPLRTRLARLVPARAAASAAIIATCSRAPTGRWRRWSTDC